MTTKHALKLAIEALDNALTRFDTFNESLLETIELMQNIIDSEKVKQ